jgi:hypothetical protein
MNTYQPQQTTGETFPLYEIVKITIYNEFQEMKKAYSRLMVAKTYNLKKVNLDIFREHFSNFFVEVMTSIKLHKVQKKDKVFIEMKFKNIETIKSYQDVKKIMRLCRDILEDTGITKIEGKMKDGYAF